MKMNLRNRFLLPMLLLIILGMGTSTVVSYIKAKGALEDEINSRLEQTANSTLEVIDAWIADQKLNVTNWSRQKTYMTAVKDSFIGKAARKSADAELAMLKSDYKYYEDINVADQSGTLVSASNEKIRRQDRRERPGLFQGIHGGQGLCLRCPQEQRDRQSGVRGFGAHQGERPGHGGLFRRFGPEYIYQEICG